MTRANLFEIMQDNCDLATTAMNVHDDVVRPATPASRGTDVPVLEEWVTALFIMHGIKARWSMNYWLVSNKAGAESGISRNHTFEEVQAVVRDLANRTARR
jgi:hypothetical protein